MTIGGTGVPPILGPKIPTLGRFVALKFLPDDLAREPQALERFRRKARAANLAHQLDPLSPIIGYVVGEVYLSDRQFDKAIEIDKKVAADNPTFGRLGSMDTRSPT